MKMFDVSQDYDRKNFEDFLYDFLPDDFEGETEDVYFDFKNIEEGVHLGSCGSLDLDIFEFRTKSTKDPRVTLTKEVVSCMKKYAYKPNALVSFYSSESHSWRLSLITTDYSKENGRLKTEHSNPRRFSFKLGKDCKAHTPEQMLFEKGKIRERTENGKTLSAIEDLKSRFALEVVSKQFFDEYKVFYEDFVQFITGNRYVKSSGKYERKSVSKENSKIFSQFKKLANDDYELACKYVRDYVKKFMGRLVFLQFLQKKGWLCVAKDAKWGDGNKNFLLDLFSASKYQGDFLEKVLEPLFFGMLNTDVEDRKNLFKAKNWDISLLDDFKQIPYLNGGLFESDSLDEIKIGFPKELFSNPAKADTERTFNDKKDYTKEPYPFTDSCGLLDFFARYNFTIDETDPADMEIGVEPEMLGKIFENLLEDNKDKGAFYTPKEIVQYMCRESLIAYLANSVIEPVEMTDSNRVVSTSSTTVAEQKIRNFVLHHDAASFTDAEKSALLAHLRAVKVCDPAVGSGAFPMGMLNELFACRVALGENEDAAEIKKQIVRENIYGVDIEKGAVDIARLRFWLAIIVDEKEPIPLPNLDYKIMQGNSLLESFEGEDLSSLTKANGALFDSEEIISQLTKAIDGFYVPSDHIAKAKIRRQISEKVLQLLKERQLPPATIKKLEKIDLHENSCFFLWHTWFGDVFGNSYDVNSPEIDVLNAEIKAINAQIAALNKSYKKGLREIVGRLINLSNFQAEEIEQELKAIKIELEKMYGHISQSIIEAESAKNALFESLNGKIEILNNELKELDKVLPKKYTFDGGFDIVIGNPPYIKEYTNKAAFDGFRENSPYYMGKMDLWYGFACHGIDLLKNRGHLCFIAQNNWTTSSGAKLMRNKVISDSKIKQLLDFNTYMVFENAEIQTMVMLFERNAKEDNYSFDYRTLLADANKADMLNLLEKKQTEKTKYLEPKIDRSALKNKLLTFSDNDDIFDKLASGKLFLQANEATNGIHTHHDCVNNKIHREFPDLPVGKAIFVLTQTEKDALNLSENEMCLIKPFYTSDEISRYYTNPKNKNWIIYTASEFKNENSMDSYPNLKAHLDCVKKAITSDNAPYGLHRAREEHFFKGAKIVSLRKCVDKPCFSYSEFDCYVPAMYYVIQTSRWNLKYLTGVLNSTLVAFWLRHKGKMQGENYQVDKEPLMGIPLPANPTVTQQKQIADLVDKILAAKTHSTTTPADTSTLERKIDLLVYHLYGLTFNEAKMIDESLTEEEFNAVLGMQ